MSEHPTAAEIINLQKEYLDKLQDISKIPILIKIIEGKTQNDEDLDLYQWLFYKDVWGEVKQPIYTRTILSNEIMLDPDVKEWNTLIYGMDLIKKYCDKENIPLQLAYSGGKGIHAHVFFDDKTLKIDEDNFKKAKKYEIDLYKIVRKALTDIIFNQSGANRLSLAIDPKKINFNQNKKGSMVREYGTQRPDGHYKTLIDHIPESRTAAQELPLVFPDEIKTWNIPDKYNRQINEAILKEIEKSKEYLEYNTEALDIRGNELKAFPCLTFLLKHGATTGNRHYGAGSITLMAKRCGINWLETQELIKQFFSKCEITEEEIKIRIENNKNYFDNPVYHFSCREIKEIFGQDVCKFYKCVFANKVIKIKDSLEKEKDSESEQISEHIKTEANRFLDEGKAIEFLMATCGKFHIGDETTIKATFGAVGSQSVINSSGIQPKVSGGSGKGKSHAIKSAFHLVPQEYIEETSLSGKALFHANVRPGTIIFSDDEDPDETIQNVIKRSTTNFQSKTKHKISVRDGNDWTTKTLVIPERIIWALTSVNDTGSLEYINRQFNLGVDESTEQDNAVWGLITDKAVIGEVDLNINDDVRICREIIRDIKKHLFAVRIPYAKRIIFNDKQNRRNGPQFLDFIRAFAVFNYRLRVKIDDNTIEANEDDFKAAVSLYTQRAPNQKLKLNDAEIAVLKLMVMNEPYTIEKLQELSKKTYHTIYFMFKGRRGRTGLLEKVPGLTYKPETEFLGESEIKGNNEFEKEYTTVKKTKPKEVFLLTVDFNSLLNFDSIATLQPEVKL